MTQTNDKDECRSLGATSDHRPHGSPEPPGTETELVFVLVLMDIKGG